MGTVALSILSKPYKSDVSELTKVAKDNLGLLPQPAKPVFKTALVGIYVRPAPYGGSDKSSNGHRYDSIPFANGMINASMSCELIHYVHEEHETFFEVELASLKARSCLSLSGLICIVSASHVFSRV